MRLFAKASSAASIDGTGGLSRRGLGAALAFLALVVLAVAAGPASAAPPAVVMGSVSDINYTSVHVSGEVNPQGESGEYRFEVSTDGGASWEARFGGNIEGSGLQPVEADINGLNGGTPYLVRLSAQNFTEFVLVSSPEPSPEFTTLTVAPATATFDPITTFSATTAHFVGQVDPNAPESAPVSDPEVEAGFATAWHFECSPECPGLQGGTVAANDSPHTVEADAAGLEPNTDYSVTLVTSHAGLIASSGPRTFHTPAAGPGVTTFPAFSLDGGTKVLVGGKVNPKNSATTYWVEYGVGAGSTYIGSVPVSQDAPVGAEGQPVFVTEVITGLNPGSRYHYRLVAHNAVGNTEGNDLDFESMPLPPAQPDCPNAKLRAETSSSALPECRAYEVASEIEKNGGDANGVMTSSADGNRVGYLSPQAFANAPANSIIGSYLGQRGPNGWTTQSMVPAQGTPNLGLFAGGYYAADFSSDLSASVMFTHSAAGEPNIRNVFSITAGGTERWVTAPTLTGVPLNEKSYAGVSADGSHIVFESSQEFVPGVTTYSVYEWVNGQVRLVSRQEDGTPFTVSTTAGSSVNGNLTSGTNFNGTLLQPTVISADGSRIFFGEGGPGSGASSVFVREDGERTVRLSVSHRTGSVGQPAFASFLGAAVDGSRVYMQSFEQLTDEPAPNGGLYSYNLETDTMHLIAADVLGLQNSTPILFSSDGKRVYFLSPAQIIPGEGVAGANNLYTSTEDGDVTFIATLPGGDPGYSGASADGSKFTFDSTERLTAFDNSGHREIYLYEVGDGSLRCVSCTPSGGPATGEATLKTTPETTVGFGRPRGVSNNGMVVFQTNQSLLPADANGVKDVYAFLDGRLSLISTGSSPYASEVGDNSPDGSNVFFVTRDSLVAQDTDGGLQDVYDARVEGGFPAPVPSEPCEGEACQGRAGAAPGFTSPGTASLSGRGNPTAPKAKKKQNTCKKKSKKHGKKCAPKSKKHQGKKHQGKHQGKKASKSGRGK